ncbi:SDR family oxidoreductase [Robiginitalea aurantiaca]|uniref:SDR family oxidoreductase n=1 Tax=Robiginitalea aurantiaca TaxID=3056915 RepID=A0ABT7WE92_9FLAO|nr:SDR family oxidoreductase [Robiginitalea aurantiaca]MDM9631149.1 SDR family oxidoreductase [Robiginitalea aurantiaca]
MKQHHKLFDLTGKTIVVAGGAGQIGFAFCEILADAGASVVLADIDVEMAKDKLSELDGNLAEKITIEKLDVSSRASVTTFFEQLEATFGSLYGLVNCFHFKGNTRKLDTSSNFFADFENYPEEAWDMVHDVNLKGAFLMSQGVIPLFKKNKGGVIVNISSTYGKVSANKSIYGDSGINSPVAYGTSKAALINFTRYLATHLAEQNIRANCLSPGGVFNNQSEEFISNYTRLTPLGRMAKAEDYQGAILFLMSDASRYMTGANLIVDGGWTAW